MKSFTTLKNLAGSLSSNTSTANLTLMGQLINDRHRYLLQKYFANERSETTSTVGGASLTLTGTLAVGATAGTLTASWAYPTCQQLVTFSNGQQRNTLFTNGSTAVSWADGLTATATAAISSVGVQYYRMPSNISKVKDFTVQVGQLKYLPKEIQTRREWDQVNFLPYTSDIPQYFFVYNGQIGIFPIPSTTGNVISYHYKTRVADLSFADVSDGHIAAAGMVAGSTAVTGLGTAWTSTDAFPSGVDISYYNLMIAATPPNGDGIWYPISKFNSDTTLTLTSPIVNAPNITASTNYVIGQFPILEEDFHDMLVYGALITYFTSIVRNPKLAEENSNLYQEKLAMLEDYAGTKTALSVDLGVEPQLTNPNLFILGS